jgi:putative oxidoreductase
MATLMSWLEAGRRLAEKIPYSIVALVARFAVASVFWRSGQTKVEGLFDIKDNTFFLFREEYKVPLLPPDLAAYMATVAEHVFPVLLLAGLASRLSALGLMVMTLVIQLFVYPEGWPEHVLWFALLLLKRHVHPPDSGRGFLLADGRREGRLASRYCPPRRRINNSAVG